MFGILPIASALRFSDEDEAVRLANCTAYSLAASVWSQDIERVHSVAERVRASTVWINTYGPTDTRLPWGGAGGESGVGRDLGRAALENYTGAFRGMQVGTGLPAVSRPARPCTALR